MPITLFLVKKNIFQELPEHNVKNSDERT